MAPNPARVASLEDALRWLDRLDRAGAAVRTTGAWPLASVLDHLAQSIEFSIDGFPQPRSPLFQATAGRAAFAVFKWRGAMRHDLAAAIPGAPALRAGADWTASAQRLRRAIQRFDRYDGVLMPHFAYGPLDRHDYALAHAFHIANHQDEIVGA